MSEAPGDSTAARSEHSRKNLNEHLRHISNWFAILTARGLDPRRHRQDPGPIRETLVFTTRTFPETSGVPAYERINKKKVAQLRAMKSRSKAPVCDALFQRPLGGRRGTL